MNIRISEVKRVTIGISVSECRDNIGTISDHYRSLVGLSILSSSDFAMYLCHGCVTHTIGPAYR